MTGKVIDMRQKRKSKTRTFSYPLPEMLKDFGYGDLEPDPFRDVYHNGYSVKNILSMNLEIDGMPEVDKIFPNQVAIALESAERDGYVSLIRNARIEALKNALEKIDNVVTEYQDYESGGFVSGEAGIKNVEIDLPTETVILTIENPEKLINTLLTGDGMFAAELGLEESKRQIERYLHWLPRYFEIFWGTKAIGRVR